MKRRVVLVSFLLVVQSAFGQDPFEKAKVSLAVHDTTLALQQFHEALKAGRKLAETNYYIGAILLAQNSVDDAIGHLKASIERDNENILALKALGDALVLKKDLAGALAQYRRAVKLAPKDASISSGYGTTLLAADSVDAAIVQLTRAKEHAPDNPVLYSSLGDAYLKQNVFVLAISNYQRAIELEPKNIATRLKLARVFYRNRQYVESVKEYDAIIGIDSVFQEAYLEKGRIYVLAKQPKNAVPPLQRLVQFRPKSVEGTALYARALYGADDYADAAKAAKNALLLDSTNAELWRVQAHSLTKTKDWPGGIAAFRWLKQHNALKPDDLADYGAALVGNNQEEEAVQVLQDAIKADSTNCDSFFPLGFIYMKHQDYARAAASFEKKIACDPRSLSAYVNGAACYMQLKNWTRTRELLMKSIELKSDFLQGRIWLGRYYAQVDSLEEAVRQYDEVLKLIGTNSDKFKKEAAEAHQQKGQLFFINKQYDRAIDSFRKSISVGNDISAIHTMWGQALLLLLDPKGDNDENKRKKEDAVQHLRRATVLDPANVQAHLWLGQALIQSRVEGDDALNKKFQEEACLEYNKVLRLDPRNDDARKAKDRIGCK